jgi:S1-C subfamily serine protease
MIGGMAMRLQMITAMALMLNSTREGGEPLPEHTLYRDLGAYGPLSPLMLKDRDIVVLPEARENRRTGDAEQEVLLPLESALEKASDNLASLSRDRYDDDADAEVGKEPEEHSTGDEPAIEIGEGVGGSSGESRMEAISQLKYGIVRIQSQARDVNLFEPWKKSGDSKEFIGSGFVVDDDDEGPLIATNAHVVSDASKVCVTLTEQSKTCYLAQVRLINHQWDLALIRLRAQVDPGAEEDGLSSWKRNHMDKHGKSKIRVLHLHNESFGQTVGQGQDVVAIGFPLGKETVAQTEGTISGSNVVNDLIVLQHAAPISPGSSGGPLVLLGGNERTRGNVVGVNFASAVGMGSQNNNYAIPAWRLAQQLNFYVKHRTKFSEDKCKEDISQCEMRVPVAASTSNFVPGDAMLYKVAGCKNTGGVYLSDLGARTTLAHADPPVKAGMVITEIDGIPLDRYGMARNEDYIDDMVSFVDLISFKDDLSDTSKVSTCSCTGNTEHKVTHLWESAFEGPLVDDSQASLMKKDFVYFGGLAMQPLSTQLARQLILGEQKMNIIQYAMKENTVCPIIITASEIKKHEENLPKVGSIVSEVNGFKLDKVDLEDFGVKTTGMSPCKLAMARLKAVFGETESGRCNTKESVVGGETPEEESTESTDEGEAKKSSFLEHENLKVWSVKTENGEYMAIDFEKGLKEVASKPMSMVTDVVSTQMKKYEITHQDNQTETSNHEETEDDAKAAVDPDMGGDKDNKDFAYGGSVIQTARTSIQVLPIEDRDIFRGGMTAQRSLDMVIKDPQRFISGNWGPSSFVEMGPGGFEPTSFMRSPESLMQLGKGRTGPSSHDMSAESLLQVSRKRSAAKVLDALRRQGPVSSLLEIGPGGMAPASFVETRQKQTK